MLRSVFAIVVFLITVTVAQATNVIFWCNETNGTYGYTKREGTQNVTSDNLMHFNSNMTCLQGLGWSNGQGTGVGSLLDCADFGYSEVTFQDNSGLPIGSSLFATNPNSGDGFDDGSCIVTSSSASVHSIASTMAFNACDNVMISSVGNLKTSYTGGRYESDGDFIRYQAGQIAPPKGSSPGDFWYYTLPSPPAWGLYLFATHLLPAPGYPYQPVMGSRMKMQNSSVVNIKANGVYVLNARTTQNVTISLDFSTAACAGYPGDHWIAWLRPNNALLWYSADPSPGPHLGDLGWYASANPLLTWQAGIENFSGLVVLNEPLTLTGTHTFYFCVDMHANEIVDYPLMCRRAIVNVTS